LIDKADQPVVVGSSQTADCCSQNGGSPFLLSNIKEEVQNTLDIRALDNILGSKGEMSSNANDSYVVKKVNRNRT